MAGAFCFWREPRQRGAGPGDLIRKDKEREWADDPTPSLFEVSGRAIATSRKEKGFGITNLAIRDPDTTVPVVSS